MVKDKKHKVEMSNDGDIFIDGHKYTFDKTKYKKIGTTDHIDKHLYREAKDDTREKNIKMIVDSIKDKVTHEEVLKELLKDSPDRQLQKIVNRIKDEKDIERQDGCLGFKFGNAYLQLIE